MLLLIFRVYFVELVYLASFSNIFIICWRTKQRVNNIILRLKMAGEQWINLVHVRMLKKIKTLKFNIHRLKRNSISKKKKDRRSINNSSFIISFMYKRLVVSVL
ncbi:hypothetical protein SO802_020513 [Lithocarpus litseifolius]|uniref:Uncharacterized protein n=1 Tax=Lithocarpus litseifolius TaxID=425828 RepID=A0AAW2CE81_9ROSI